MKTIMRRIRGILGSVLAWGSAWFAGGLVFILSWGLIETARRSLWDIWGTKEFWYFLFSFAGSTAVIGAITGGAFAAYIASNFRHKRLQDLSPIRFALGGGLVTILLRLVSVTTETLESARNLYGVGLDSLWPSLALFGLAGAATGFASLKLAQRGQLAGGEEAGRLASQSTTLLPEPWSEPG